MEARKM